MYLRHSKNPRENGLAPDRLLMAQKSGDGSFSDWLKGFIHPRRLFGISEPSQVPTTFELIHLSEGTQGSRGSGTNHRAMKHEILVG